MMQNNEQIFNPKNDNLPPFMREAHFQLDTSHVDPGVPESDDMLTLLLEAVAYEQQEAHERDHSRGPLPMSTLIRLQITEEILAGPSKLPILAATIEGEELWRIVQERANYRNNQTSLTNTKDLHLGYPYQENIDNNKDLPQPHYPCPYLITQVN
jgi:hypothetical protein